MLPTSFRMRLRDQIGPPRNGSKKSDGEWKRRREAEAKCSEAEKAQSALKLKQEEARGHADSLSMEVETLKNSDQEHREKISHLDKASEVAASELHNAKEQYREVAEAAAPLVDALAPGSSSVSHDTLCGEAVVIC